MLTLERAIVTGGFATYVYQGGIIINDRHVIDSETGARYHCDYSCTIPLPPRCDSWNAASYTGFRILNGRQHISLYTNGIELSTVDITDLEISPRFGRACVIAQFGDVHYIDAGSHLLVIRIHLNAQ